jgi:cytochrome d ubiquinol oxidase subunit I
MQTPAAYKIVGTGQDAKAILTDFWPMVFNPSSVDRLVHVILGCWLAGSCLLLSVSAYYFLKKIYLPFARTSMKVGLITTLIVLVLQLVSADSTARGVAKHQPSKFAAMEGVYETKAATPITLFGWVDEKNEKVIGLQIPGLLSLMTSRSLDPVKGFDQIPKDERPPIQLTFQSYHLMVMMWGLMVLAVILGTILWRKNKLEKSKWTLRFLVVTVLFPQIANQVGWITAEVGRQPWVVYGLLKTVDGVSKSIHASQVMGSIIMFIILYFLLFGLFLFLVDRKIKHGPTEGADDDMIYQNLYSSTKGRIP